MESLPKIGGSTSSWEFLLNFIFGVYLAIYYIFNTNDLEESKLKVNFFTFLSLPNKFSLNFIFGQKSYTMVYLKYVLADTILWSV